MKDRIDFLEKNKEAAKVLTKSQSQARVIESKTSVDQEKTTKRLPDNVTKSGQIPNYLVRMKEETAKKMEEVKQAEFEQEVKNRTLETTDLE